MAKSCARYVHETVFVSSGGNRHPARFHGRLTKLALPRQPPLVATLHRTSPQLATSRPARLLNLLLVTGPFVVLRQTLRFLGTWLYFRTPPIIGGLTVEIPPRTSARNVRHGDIPVPTRLVARVMKQPGDEHMSPLIPPFRELDVPPDYTKQLAKRSVSEPPALRSVALQTFGRRLLQNMIAIGPLSPPSLLRKPPALALATSVFPVHALTVAILLELRELVLLVVAVPNLPLVH